MFGIHVDATAPSSFAREPSALMCNAIARFNLIGSVPGKKTLELMRNKIAETKAKLHAAPDAEERAWAQWGNLQAHSKL